MEHRCTNRYVSDLNIQIYQDKMPVALGRIKNASLAGVFVETEFRNIDCERQVLLEILHNRNNAFKPHRIKIPALVAHKGNNGFGAELDITSQEQADLFAGLLFTQQLPEPKTFAQVVCSNNKIANG